MKSINAKKKGGPKRALVVGMNDYKPESGLNQLSNAVPDARAVKSMLRDQGVEVFYGENLPLRQATKLLTAMMGTDCTRRAFSGISRSLCPSTKCSIWSTRRCERNLEGNSNRM